MTAIGPVDLLCRDADGGHVAVEVKRRGEIDGVEQLTRYLELMNRDPLLAPVAGVFAAQQIKPQARTLADRPRHPLRDRRLRRPARDAEHGPAAVLTGPGRQAGRVGPSGGSARRRVDRERHRGPGPGWGLARRWAPGDLPERCARARPGPGGPRPSA